MRRSPAAPISTRAINNPILHKSVPVERPHKLRSLTPIAFAAAAWEIGNPAILRNCLAPSNDHVRDLGRDGGVSSKCYARYANLIASPLPETEQGPGVASLPALS
jgi:hypothetical protein